MQGNWPPENVIQRCFKSDSFLCLWWVRVLKTQAYWHATSCRLVNIYQLFGREQCFHIPTKALKKE